MSRLANLGATFCLAALTTATSTVAFAQDAGDFFIRARGIAVAPTENVSDVLPTFPGGSASVETAYVPELDFTYFVRDNIAVELILATSPHDLNGTGVLAPVGELADVMVLPPTLTVQYHFPAMGKFRPYAGVGINYTMFYDANASEALIGAIGSTDVQVDESLGVAFQAGLDIDIDEKWFFNMDVKYIQIDTEATLDTSGLINTLDIDLDPIVAGFGIGYRF